MGYYINLEAVKVRLSGKVRFTTDDNDENRMSEKLANRLINEAEGQVEQDCSPRYAAPFEREDGAPFSELPDRPTKEILRTLCELQACLRVLETDFGRGTVSDADKYCKSLEKRYKDILDRLMAKKTDGGQESAGWKYPPMTGLKLNYFNLVSDDGYIGSVLTTTDGIGSYPFEQINSPGETWWNSILGGGVL